MNYWTKPENAAARATVMKNMKFDPAEEYTQEEVEEIIEGKRKFDDRSAE